MTPFVAVRVARARGDRRTTDRHLPHETRFGVLAVLPHGMDRGVMGGSDRDETISAIAVGASTSFDDRGRQRYGRRGTLRGQGPWTTKVSLRQSWSSPCDGREAPAYDGRNADGALACCALQAVRTFILHNLASELTIARLADVAQLSPHHFSRAFTRKTGSSPHRYIMQVRADQAAAAIRAGRQSLAGIAYAHGFTDQSHLCRWIRRRYGTTPTGLRRAKAGGLPLDRVEP